MMKRMIGTVLAVGMIVASLAGCGSSASKTETKAQTEVIAESASKTKTDETGSDDFTTIQVFIAASLGNAMEEIADNYKAVAPNVAVVYNPDSSGKLQTQIEAGGACDIFFSAATKQMNALVDDGFVKADDVVQLLENKVQLIKPAGSETAVTGFDNIPDAANIALAADTVPVGQYAREIFENLGITDEVMAMEINECDKVTSVLAAVSEGSNEIGIVYATDAASVADKVEVIAEADDTILKTPVIYPVARVTNAEADEAEMAAADAFIDYLRTDDAKVVFEKYGFTVQQ